MEFSRNVFLYFLKKFSSHISHTKTLLHNINVNFISLFSPLKIFYNPHNVFEWTSPLGLIWLLSSAFVLIINYGNKLWIDCKNALQLLEFLELDLMHLISERLAENDNNNQQQQELELADNTQGDAMENE